MIRLFQAALWMLGLQLSVLAQEQRAEVVQKLYELPQDVLSNKITPVRGGTKEKPLGCYIGGRSDLQFRSGYGYKDVEPTSGPDMSFSPARAASTL